MPHVRHVRHATDVRWQEQLELEAEVSAKLLHLLLRVYSATRIQIIPNRARSTFEGLEAHNAYQHLAHAYGCGRGQGPRVVGDAVRDAVGVPWWMQCRMQRGTP